MDKNNAGIMIAQSPILSLSLSLCLSLSPSVSLSFPLSLSLSLPLSLSLGLRTIKGPFLPASSCPALSPQIASCLSLQECFPFQCFPLWRYFVSWYASTSTNQSNFIYTTHFSLGLSCSCSSRGRRCCSKRHNIVMSKPATPGRSQAVKKLVGCCGRLKDDIARYQID